jgi:hypothetical protein
MVAGAPLPGIIKVASFCERALWFPARKLTLAAAITELAWQLSG